MTRATMAAQVRVMDSVQLGSTVYLSSEEQKLVDGRVPVFLDEESKRCCPRSRAKMMHLILSVRTLAIARQSQDNPATLIPLPRR